MYLVQQPGLYTPVAGRNEIPWSAAPLRHLEMTTGQGKQVLKATHAVVVQIEKRARCAERRQQRQMPSLDEDQREFVQADWTSIFSVSFLFWLANEAFMEFYRNSILRCLCCPCLQFFRCLSCFCIAKLRRRQTENRKTQAAAVISFLDLASRNYNGQLAPGAEEADVVIFLQMSAEGNVHYTDMQAACSFVRYWGDMQTGESA